MSEVSEVSEMREVSESAALRFENLRRVYGSRVVLDIPAGSVVAGGITGIIGPNGAGKTTLLNIIAHLDQPTDGQVLYGEGASSKIPGREVTMLFQNPLLIHTTVEANITYPLKLRGWSPQKRRSRAQELMAKLDLTELAKRASWKLSGGERQKVAFARALSFRPRLLLMDEPTSNIDNATIAEIESLLKQTNQIEGTTVLLASHNLAQIRRLCDFVLFLHKGVLIEAGPAKQLLDAPKTPLLRSFVKGELLT
jgi:tungstate transport system ATP-binding protein